MLPIANSVTARTFQLGEYIIKEGEVPKGLYMIVKGLCKVGSEKLMIRSKHNVEYERRLPKPKPFTIKGNFKDAYIREEQRNRERIPVTEESLQERLTEQEYERLIGGKDRMVIA